MDKDWESAFIAYFQKADIDQSDASHDLGHFQRVAATAKQIASLEKSSVDLLVMVAAAYFHDIVSLPKNHPDARLSSLLAAKKAQGILEQLHFPQEKIASVCHAIQAHSFSAKIPPQTLEAQIIQDADRMEALGALGIMRTFYVSGRMGSAPYHPTDLMGEQRDLDDRAFALDHFSCKLFKLPSLLQTRGGRQLAEQRVEFLHRFVHELVLDLQKEFGPNSFAVGSEARGALVVAQACHEAGAMNRPFFSPEDPLATKRPLQPQNFVLDRLLEARGEFSPFLSEFLRQLEDEI